MSSGPLDGKVALLTGAARGIGRACALHLARLGADVAVLDIDLHSFEQFEVEAAQMTSTSTVEEVRALGRRSVGLTCDATDSAAVSAAVDAAVAELGRVDIGVCIAGGGEGSFEDTRASIVPDDVYERTIQRNLSSTIYTCKSLARHMKAAGAGRIITMSSLSGRQAEATGGYAHYGAAKAGIAMYTRYLARDLGPFGITVNCLAPGYIRTGRLSLVFDSEGSDRLLSTVPLGRYGTSDDCAGVVGFLASDAAAYVSGAVIPIDGATGA